MHEFSGYYKKMCAKAEEIQERWKHNIQDWDEYSPKGDYKDCYGSQVQVKIDDVDEIVENNIWLPLAYQIERKYFMKSGINKLWKMTRDEFSKFAVNYTENAEKSKKIKEHFKGDSLWNVLALMFVMKKYHGKKWDFCKEDWVEISGG